ncbi:hypothetical protein Tco_0272944 [Tanacetum coccineum]
MMKSHLAPKPSVQVNKIAFSCEICDGPHDTQYCMENPEQTFVNYASSRTDEAGDREKFDRSLSINSYNRKTYPEKSNKAIYGLGSFFSALLSLEMSDSESSYKTLNALASKSVAGNSNDENDVSVINCEVVLFDHLLWMLENAEFNVGSECFDELAHLYSSTC